MKNVKKLPAVGLQTKDSVDQIALAIQDISNGMKRINESRLNEKAILLLVSHASGVSQNQVKMVLNGLENLKQKYLKKSGDV